MSEETKSISQSDAVLAHARELVARILDFVASDGERLKRFLPMTGFNPETAQDSAQSPLFMLSVLDSAIKDEELLRSLQEHERIGPAVIELTQARLAFQVAAELTRPSDQAAEDAAVKDRVRLQLRALKRLLRER